jgi:hypothetical protein
MKQKLFYLIMALLLIITIQLQAQSDSAVQVSMQSTPPVKQVKQKHHLNIVKINLAPLLFKSYSLQYERVLSKEISVAVQYRTMPETGIPFKSDILKLVDDEDPDTKKIIEDFKMSNYAITPEVRIYLSRKGYGRGFYFAPFYRYASFTSNDLNVFYTSDDDNTEQSIKMSGKLTSNTFGLAIGAQSALGKRFVLDWSFFGPHYGSGKGVFSGTTSQPLTPDEQDDLREQLDDIDIPLTDKTVDVNANGASLKLDGPWAGWRFTIALGFRF